LGVFNKANLESFFVAYVTRQVLNVLDISEYSLTGSALRLGFKATEENLFQYIDKNTLFILSTTPLFWWKNLYLMIVSRLLLFYGFLEVSQIVLRQRLVKDHESGLTMSVKTVIMARRARQSISLISCILLNGFIVSQR